MKTEIEPVFVESFRQLCEEKLAAAKAERIRRLICWGGVMAVPFVLGLDLAWFNASGDQGGLLQLAFLSFICGVWGGGGLTYLLQRTKR